MATPVIREKMTYEEYLAFERASPDKHEFVGGEVYAMAGGRKEHARVAVRFASLLEAALGDRPCEVFNSDMRVGTGDGVATYPDVHATCAPRVYSDDKRDELRNPELIVEVLSDNTEAYDRGDKFAHYRSTPSFHEYVLASSARPYVEVFTREDGGAWRYRAYGPGEQLSLSIGCSLSVDELYRKVFDAPSAP